MQGKSEKTKRRTLRWEEVDAYHKQTYIPPKLLMDKALHQRIENSPGLNWIANYKSNY